MRVLIDDVVRSISDVFPEKRFRDARVVAKLLHEVGTLARDLLRLDRMRASPLELLGQVGEILLHGNEVRPRDEFVAHEKITHDRLMVEQETRHGEFGEQARPRRATRAAEVDVVPKLRQLVRVESLRRGDDDAVILQRVVQLIGIRRLHIFPREERVEIERLEGGGESGRTLIRGGERCRARLARFSRRRGHERRLESRCDLGAR